MAPMIVMGLFGFLGKAVKGVAKGIGKVAKVGVGVAKFGLTSGLLPIPGGGLAGKLAGTLLQAKRPMATTAQKFPIPISVLRAKTPSTAMRLGGRILTASTPRLQQQSPILPGGAIATRNGPVAATSAAPPLNFSGSAPAKRKRKKRSSSRRRSSAKRRGGKRKLKFGSPAWRKKYLGHGRKRRKRRAA